MYPCLPAPCRPFRGSDRSTLCLPPEPYVVPAATAGASGSPPPLPGVPGAPSGSTQYRSITDESYPTYLTAPCAGPAGCLQSAAPVAPVQPVGPVLPARPLLARAATGLCLVLACALLWGCEGTAAADAPVPRRPLVVYLALDNDLSGECDARLAALCSGWRAGMDVWVYADTPSGASLRHLEPTPSGAEARTVETYGDENSASGATLGRVLRSVWQRSPSDGYGLLFFSHATGWLPEGALARPHAEAAAVASGAGGGATRTLGRDGSAEMSPEAFAAAIPEGMPLDYIAFEACLVAGAEVALELCGRTELLLASSAELLVPGFRPLYGDGLELLTSRRAPAEHLLAAFAERYMRYVRQECTGAYRSATLSVVRTSSLPALASAVHRATAGRAGETASEELLSQLQHFDRPGQYGDRPAAARFFDLEDYVERLHAASGADMASLAAFRAALEDAVVWSDATEQFMGGAGAPYGGFDIDRHGGLTTYVPRAEFPSLNDSYTHTAWWRAVASPVCENTENDTYEPLR